MNLRIGILGAARVATYAMIDAANHVVGVSVAGLAARDPARAHDYAAAHGIPTVFDSYDALLASPLIDAVYNALPPSLHARWSIAALEAGKPVLCEKPFALTLADTDAMLAAEAHTGRLLMEAQHSHYHPLSARMRDVVQGGMLGAIRSVDAVFDAPVSRAEGEIRYDPALGGGALWDLGVYPAYWIRSTLGDDLKVVTANQRLAPSGADIETSAVLQSANGARITLSCNMDAPFAAHIRFEGDRGTLVIDNPLHPQSGHRFALTVDGVTTEEQFSDRATYAYQLDAFRDAITMDAPVATRGADTRATMALLTAIQEAARS
jgi:predicted dehydrogenase